MILSYYWWKHTSDNSQGGVGGISELYASLSLAFLSGTITENINTAKQTSSSKTTDFEHLEKWSVCNTKQ